MHQHMRGDMENGTAWEYAFPASCDEDYETGHSIMKEAFRRAEESEGIKLSEPEYNLVMEHGRAVHLWTTREISE